MTEYPTYQSPLRTFEALGISADSIDLERLNFEKKRLLLEIQISDKQTTTIGEREYSKNDVIELFDTLKNINNLEYHKAIFNHPKLLYLLENAEVSSDSGASYPLIRFKTVDEWEAFTAFVSPYLAQAIDKLLTKVIRTLNFNPLLEIKPFFKLMTQSDKFYAFRKLNSFCETLDDRLENLAYKHTTFPTEETAYLCYAPFYDAVNELVDSHPNMPNSVAHALINFTVECERKVGRGKKLVEISDQARRLHCDAQYTSLIKNNREAFYETREQVLGYNPNQVWRILVGAIVVIGLMFRVASRCGDRPNYQTNTPDFREIMDNVRQIKVDKSGKTYYVPIRRSGDTDFDESSFVDLHERVVSSVQQNDLTPLYLIPEGEPGILSPFRSDSTGSKYSIYNKTPSDMIMVIATGESLNSYFIPAGNSTSFTAQESASMFFYGGQNWTDDQTIQHLHISPRTKDKHIIQFNGSFSTQLSRDLEFLRKFFTLTDGEAENFTIEEKKGNYELYQGDRFVNYSY